MLGTGLLKGLAVTAKNFVGSYHDPARMVTVSYPEEKAPIGENYRSFPFLVCEDGADPMTTLRCVACQICEKECPPQCIYIEKSKDKKPDATGKQQFYPAVFDIDTSVCMSCGICAEVCPFDSIKMDKVFEVGATDRFTGLLLTRELLAKSNVYYNQIRPTEAAEVDERLGAERKAAEEKAKAAAAAAAAKAAAAKAAAAAAAAPAQPASPAPTASPAAQPKDESRPSSPSEGGQPAAS
ncbi:MAG: 4Fe-4S dicluster domain-containing protein [Candidatus Didemnitutus sp.]|nr:4Fe-4S dicluster domain-containing protein [Candidatus Didemnitutus sp.]